MTLVIDGHPFHYEMENLCRIFYPRCKITVTPEPNGDPVQAYTALRSEAGGRRVVVRLCIDGRERAGEELLPPQADDREAERRMSVLLWGMFADLTGYRPEWGILTGVRPIKLFGRLAAEKGGEEAVAFFEKALLVSPQKAKIALETWRNQKKLLDACAPGLFSLYVAIPFCPTRCAYCSFVSSSVEKTLKLVPKYVELLCGELRRTGQIAAELHLRPESVYFGGGTPTVLSAEQLETLIRAVGESFDLSACREFTVEAGRPDTITEEKLDAMKRGGVTRISINPQTLNDEVLREIGRRHTAAQALEAFALARRRGFSNINMDLIAGLPKDDMGSFRRTLEQVIALSPESVTVHTLALKRAARLAQEDRVTPGEGALAGGMIGYADDALLRSGYRPYYLYRQSRMVGNQENTGWARPGMECFYNVVIMEECQTILACGAGAVTKLRDPDSDRIERVFNFKYPYEYIDRYEEMMLRKDRVKKFYGELQGGVRHLPEQRG